MLRRSMSTGLLLILSDGMIQRIGPFAAVVAGKEDAASRPVGKRGNALKNGDFYASMGPEIHELYIEDGYVHIKTSPAKRISLVADIRSSKSVWAEPGSTVTEASFPIRPYYGYIRLTVMDEHGRCANTQAYFMDSLNT